VTTIQSELVPEEEAKLPAVPLPPNASITAQPAFPDAVDVIRRVRKAMANEYLLVQGYREMAAETSEWSETTFAAQAETLPKE
jgi:hypothetical protein